MGAVIQACRGFKEQRNYLTGIFPRRAAMSDTFGPVASEQSASIVHPAVQTNPQKGWPRRTKQTRIANPVHHAAKGESHSSCERTFAGLIRPNNDGKRSIVNKPDP